MAATATQPSRSRASSLTRRPTTPLRRISATSLRALSLSHSRSRSTAGSAEPPLQHLSQVFAELADSVSDLAGNLDALDQVNDKLDGFNEAFASYLYGLRITAYTADFNEAPTRVNFDLAASRQPLSPPASFFPLSSPPGSPSGHGQGSGNETTFMTNDGEHSFVDATPKPSATRGGRGGLRGGGGGGRGGVRGGKSGGMTRKKKEEMIAFADAIIQTLPIRYREQQPLRSETEKVIQTLRENPQGLTMADTTKITGVLGHRVNDALTALVRAKAVIKSLAHGATTYRFDPNKYPSTEA